MDLFKDSEFAALRATLDGEMKRLQASGVGSKKRQAEVITLDEGNKLWESGQLPKVLPIIDVLGYDGQNSSFSSSSSPPSDSTPITKKGSHIIST